MSDHVCVIDRRTPIQPSHTAHLRTQAERTEYVRLADIMPAAPTNPR